MTSKLSDVCPTGTKDNPTRVNVEEIINTPIVISDVSFAEGENGDYARVLFQAEGEEVWGSFMCGGVSVVAKLKKVVEQKALPVSTTLVKIGRAYDLR